MVICTYVTIAHTFMTNAIALVVNVVLRNYVLIYTKKRNVKVLDTTVIKIDLIAVLTFILSIDIIESMILQRNHDGLRNSISSYLD